MENIVIETKEERAKRTLEEVSILTFILAILFHLFYTIITGVFIISPTVYFAFYYGFIAAILVYFLNLLILTYSIFTTIMIKRKTIPILSIVVCSFNLLYHYYHIWMLIVFAYPQITNYIASL